MTSEEVRERLEYLRGEIRAECISYAELAELQSLAEYIEPGDVELLEWAGVPEDDDDYTPRIPGPDTVEGARAMFDAIEEARINREER